MKSTYPKIVCWRLTSVCNRKCPFCFRPESNNLDTKSVFKIIDKLAASGVKGVGITGGEPLSRPDISKIFKHLSDKKIKICLATNTDYYKKNRNIINKYVSTIGIPIEASSGQNHDKIRGKGNFKHVIETLNDVYKENKIKMYFSTVLTKYNINDLENIENLLLPYKKKIIYWKIYELMRYYKANFQSKTECNGLSKIVKPKFEKLGKKLGKNKFFYLSSDDRSGASFLINPDGRAIVPVESDGKTKDIALGNFLTDNIGEIFDKWNHYTDFSKYQCHKCALKSSCLR
ncbi:MAG: radical SAM protein [Patescibacteria group bacterium]